MQQQQKNMQKSSMLLPVFKKTLCSNNFTDIHLILSNHQNHSTFIYQKVLFFSLQVWKHGCVTQSIPWIWMKLQPYHDFGFIKINYAALHAFWSMMFHYFNKLFYRKWNESFVNQIIFFDVVCLVAEYGVGNYFEVPLTWISY